VTSFGPCTLANFKVITEEVASGAPQIYDNSPTPQDCGAI
jgi:hypothetical protein